MHAEIGAFCRLNCYNFCTIIEVHETGQSPLFHFTHVYLDFTAALWIFNLWDPDGLFGIPRDYDIFQGLP